MGDSRGRGNGATGYQGNQLDAQFLQDLERATRLSLESFKTEQGRGGGKRLFSPPESRIMEWNGREKERDLEITPRPRPLARPLSAITSQSQSTPTTNGILRPPPSTSSDSPTILPPSEFKRHRSFPYRRHLTHPPPVGDIVAPKEDQACKKNSTLASDDLILLASPLVTPKFNLNGLPKINCDTPYASPVDDISPSPTMSNPTFPPSTNVSGASNVPFVSSQPPRMVFPFASQPMSQGLKPTPISYPTPVARISPTPGFGTTSTVIGGILHNLNKGQFPGGTRAFNGIKPPTLPPSTLYKQVSDDLREMSGDLIDFGTKSAHALPETSGHTILEYFDPIVIREAERKLAEETDRHRPNVETVPAEKMGTDRVEEIYNASCASTATSAFTYRPNESGTISLYPSLQELEYESIYGTLTGTLRRMQDRKTSGTYYDVYNPFEYSYTVSCSSPASSLQRAPATGFFTTDLPPSSSTRRDSMLSSSSIASSQSSRVQVRIRSMSHDKSKRRGKLYENIENVVNIPVTDSEIQSFAEMIRGIRQSCRHVDSMTNKGFIRSPVMENNSNPAGYSVKIVVWLETVTVDPVTFTSDISSPGELILEQCISELVADGSARDFVLRVKGRNEYLDKEIPLANYVYVQHCIKMDDDVQFVLVKKASMIKYSYARSELDDTKAEHFSIDELLPYVPVKKITFDEISLLLQVIDTTAERFKEKVNAYMQGGFTKDSNSTGILSPALVIQPVKGVCVLLNEVVTIEIVNCLNFFVTACEDWNSKVKVPSPSILDSRDSLDPFQFGARRAKIIGDVGNNFSFVEVLPSTRDCADTSAKDLVVTSMDRLAASVSDLVEMYSKSFPVSFRMKDVPCKSRPESQDIKPMGERNDPFLIRVGAIHRLKVSWLGTYIDYFLVAEVLYGSRWMGSSSTGYSPVTRMDGNLFFNTVLFDTWIRFDHVPICIIPREARVVFTLFGRKPSEDNSTSMDMVELGWASVQCISFKGLLVQGDYLLPFWDSGLPQERTGPAPNSTLSLDWNAPLITIEFIDFGQDMHFPEIPKRMEFRRDFSTLDTNTQVLLKDIIGNTTTKIPPEDNEILWEKRLYLQDFPQALPKVLAAAQLWDWASVADTYALVNNWKPMSPFAALELLMPSHADIYIRGKAVEWISGLEDEDLTNLLPQLVEALCYETFDSSPLAKLLSQKALSSVAFSHSLFWMLTSQIGLGKWTSEQPQCDPVVTRVSRPEQELPQDPKNRRLELMLNALMINCGEKGRSALISQFKMMENLADIAAQVKAATKDSTRATILVTELQRLNAGVFNGTTSIPLPCSPSVYVKSIHPNPKMSSYFNSNALPLKISFLSGLPEGGCVSTIFKSGDDLRQDMLTLQTIRLIEKWWLKEGLDLRVITFACVPTGLKQGLVEMVPNAETLCKIHAEYGVTGVFRDSAIADWLTKNNPSCLEYRRAVENFTLSCAAYCVITYILGICDRHNDNIMLTKKGHLFHIDFGKFLGDAQLFIKFKRDRTPFVLTSDMMYVINEGEQTNPTHRFVEHCFRAFEIIRKNGDELLTLFRLMSTAGIPGVDQRSVLYIQDALLPDCSRVEAAATFTRYIEESSQNWFTPVNFFLHSLAQIRFSSDTSDNPKTMTFIPTVHTMEEEGRIEQAIVVSCEKKYEPEKYYSYTIKLKRKGHADWSFLHRSYKEFLEFRSKLCINFPKANGSLVPLPRRGGIGRSNVKEVAEKRREQLQNFLQSLFALADEIAHSNLVYTFFHPIYRDQHLDEESDRKTTLLKDPSRIHGQIKLSLQYGRGALQILVLHAVDLACPNGQPPSTYVKTYLRPDTSRLTKRKTRVIRRSQHPSFMEVLSYRLPLEIIRQRTLQISVWHHDSFQENSFLGGTSIPLANAILNKDLIETFTLTNI